MHDGCSVSDHRRAIGRLDGVFEGIVDAKRTHSSVARVLEEACRTLQNLALNDGTTCTCHALYVELLRLVQTVSSHGWCGADNKRAIRRVDGVFDAILNALFTYKTRDLELYASDVLWTLAVNAGTLRVRRQPTVSLLWFYRCVRLACA